MTVEPESSLTSHSSKFFVAPVENIENPSPTSSPSEPETSVLSPPKRQEAVKPPHIPSQEPKTEPTNARHNAGYDALATAFLFAFYVRHQTNKEKWPELANKIYLGGKQFPLLLVESKFPKFS